MKIPTTVAEFEQTFPQDNLKWSRVTGSPRFDYPIDYQVAVLNVDDAEQRIDFISRW